MKKPKINKRRKLMLLVIVLLCLFLASALELYTFGFADNFFVRWFRTFFVLFVLISVTAVGIVPGVTYLVNRIIKRFSF